MTVKQLIEELQVFPQDTEIAVEDYEDDMWRKSIVKIEFTGKRVILEIEAAKSE